MRTRPPQSALAGQLAGVAGLDSQQQLVVVQQELLELAAAVGTSCATVMLQALGSSRHLW